MRVSSLALIAVFNSIIIFLPLHFVSFAGLILYRRSSNLKKEHSILEKKINHLCRYQCVVEIKLSSSIAYCIGKLMLMDALKRKSIQFPNIHTYLQRYCQYLIPFGTLTKHDRLYVRVNIRYKDYFDWVVHGSKFGSKNIDYIKRLQSSSRLRLIKCGVKLFVKLKTCVSKSIIYAINRYSYLIDTPTKNQDCVVVVVTQ